ncbi:UCH-domain-containing protein [Whalleya microplaca]|nr:UCH-domain-containing protein [Whalleya microplaca]
MGGAAEFPDRASSPLKRRASSMEPDNNEQDANEDVDMITAPPSETMDTSSPEQVEGVEGSPDASAEGQTSATTNGGTVPSLVTSLGPVASVEGHIKSIRAFVDEQNLNPLSEGQQCFLVSKRWLEKVPDESSAKHTAEDLASIPPVDNSDIILEIIDDPCVGTGVADILKKKFVRLKQGYDTEQFEPVPPPAWDLLMQWPGLKDGQMPITRYAQNTVEQGKNIMWEWHPPVFSVYRLWSAISTVPVEASMKLNNPPPAKLARSRSYNFQALLKQAKKAAGIDLNQRTRVWSVPQIPQREAQTEASSNSNTVPTPPASPQNSQTSDTTPQPWNHMLLDVASFLALEKNSEREAIDYGDLGSDRNHHSTKTLNFFSLIQDQGLVLDLHETGTYWTSNYSPNKDPNALPSRNSSSSLTVQSRKPTKNGRTSPVSQGPVTRGRTTKSGRTPGCVGLGNLGNTCYMNAALQCVRSVEELTKYFLAGEWEAELNKDNILAHNGDVAAAYAQLLREIYKDAIPSSVTPRHFKNTIGRYATGFSGYGQQDSQEFLGFLLDGLQEDLSRIKKKPYIEKPDSTDEMINDPEAIRQMAAKVWDITKKRDDSVIADLFTGLYKSTLVCPDCGKVSITFDPFNNLTLPLPVENKWAHTVKFFPLNDKPIDIKVELEKSNSIKSLKEFVSVRTGVPSERLFGAEEWKGRFYKFYPDQGCASEEITGNDNAWIFELEAKPTNYGAKPTKPQKLGMTVRSLVDEEEHNAAASWNDEQAEKLLVPVFHRRPMTGKAAFHAHRWTAGCAPHFIVVTPEEARSENTIRRKILEKVATFTSHPFLSRFDESDSSESTDPEMIASHGSDESSSSNESKGVQGQPARQKFNRRKPTWTDPSKFLPPELQNLFDIGFYSESNSWMPTGMNGISDDKSYPKLSTRAPVESPSSEDQFDNATNGTASNDDTSSDEASRQSTDIPITRMNEESDDEDNNPVVKVRYNKSYSWNAWDSWNLHRNKRRCNGLTLTCDQNITHRPKQSRQSRPNGKVPGGNKKKMKQYKAGKGGKGSKKQQRQHKRELEKKKAQTFEIEDSYGSFEPSPDGGPLIRLREALIVDWSDQAYESVFSDSKGSLTTWDDCQTLPDPDLDRAQAARLKRRKHGISLEACLDEFERDEILSEQDMWYCPRCKEHRRASKKFDLWKTPDILIIHLKRFSSSGFRRDKLEVLVDFPIENLDITSRVLCKEDGKQEVYDLIGVDCHWGGLGGGHYTAHAKNFVDDQWYTYNDSSVSRSSPDKIVDTSAYLLFYRRRSDVPLGGPRFSQILERFVDHDSSDNELSNSGEGRRLDESFSQNGSSSALQGAEATHLRGNPGGNAKTAQALNRADSAIETKSIDDGGPLLGNPSTMSKQTLHQSIEDDEGIDLTDDNAQSAGFNPMGGNNSWNFEGILGDGGAGSAPVAGDSPLDSGAASDVAQLDSSGDERVASPHLEFEPEFPGMSHYELPPQPEGELPVYHEPPPPQYGGEMTRDDMTQIWDQKHKVHEVPAAGNDESEEAAEIHLTENDKIKL